MKPFANKIILLSFLLVTIELPAQHYFQLHFTGNNHSLLPDSVKVENLTSHSSLMVKDTLGLYLLLEDSLFVLPDSLGYTLGIFTPTRQSLSIAIKKDNQKLLFKTYSVSPEQPLWLHITNMQIGSNYYVKLHSLSINRTILLKGKKQTSFAKEQIRKIVSVECRKTDPPKATYTKYRQGDILKLTAYFGMNRTIALASPTKNQTIDFVVSECVDADGRHYAVMQVGNDIWMVENLTTSTYQNGDTIPEKTDSLWEYGTIGARRAPYDIQSYGQTNGYLYNWYAIADKRHLAPKGWHVPTYNEWSRLMQQIGMNDTLRNLIGQPAGYCDVNGEFANYGTTGYWWLSTEFSAQKAWYSYRRQLDASISLFYADKHHGFAVRCVKDKK